MSNRNAEAESVYAFVNRITAEIESGKFDVATHGKTALFYSGWRRSSQQNLALNMYKKEGGTAGRFAMIDFTPGGLKLAELINARHPKLDRVSTDQLWTALSTKFANGVRGTVIAFVDKMEVNRIFGMHEWRALANNPHVTNVISNERVRPNGPNVTSGPNGRLTGTRAGFDKFSLF